MEMRKRGNSEGEKQGVDKEGKGNEKREVNGRNESIAENRRG